MTADRQPTTNDYRKRIARPLYIQGFASQDPEAVDTAVNDYSDRVTDHGGEVTDIRTEYGGGYFNRTVLYRASSRIEP